MVTHPLWRPFELADLDKVARVRVGNPPLDADLVVADSADEAAYLPDLEAAGFSLRVREPDWEEHRLFTDPGLSTNLHVFSPGSPEVDYNNHKAALVYDIYERIFTADPAQPHDPQARPR